MSDRVKVGLIGCGGISRRHVEWFLDHPSCEIVALCDPVSEAVEERESAVLEKRPDATVSTTDDYRALLAADDIDAVAILLPHHLHYPVAKEALEKGKHVLVEKPMVTDVDHARELVATAEKNDRLICIGYQRSYMSEYVYVRRMIEAGEFGEIQFVSAHLEQGWYSNVTGGKKKDSWRTDPASVGGGQMVDTGSHTVAAMLDVTRLVPEKVFAFVDRKDLEVDVNTAAVVRFAGGAIGTFCVGGFGHSVTEVLRVVGEKKSARIFFRTVKEQSLEIDGEVIDAKGEMPSSTPNANLVDAILGKARIEAGGELGLNVALLTEAVYESAATNVPASIDRD